MRLIKSKYEIIEQSNGLKGIYKNIELIGKVSHKSEGNIKEGSAKTFVDNMIKLGHLATLEFGTVYLKIPIEEYKKNYKDKYFPQE